MADDKESKEEVDVHDPHYDPIIQLPDTPADTKTFEEDEVEVLKLRAKLFRFDTSEPPGEWKERGTGEVKLLQHKETRRVRIVMRRDKTLKMCANHYITSTMNLISSAGSERAWVWHTAADFADGETKEERLAIRFANAENAQKFKTHFDESKVEVDENKQNGAGEGQASDSEDEKNEEKEADTSKDKDDAEPENPAKDVEPVKEDASQEPSTETETGTAETADEVAKKLGEIKLEETSSKGDE